MKLEFGDTASTTRVRHDPLAAEIHVESGLRALPGDHWLSPCIPDGKTIKG